MAADVTFFCWSDCHYLVQHTASRPKVSVINSLPGTPYPSSLGGGTVATPRGIIMQGDLIDDGWDNTRNTTQWANYISDFGVNGEGRCLFPVYEAAGNHDMNATAFVYNKIAERNVTRKNLSLISNISPNGFHYSWDWDGVHFVNLNLACANIWQGECDTYSVEHDPKLARDFLIQDLMTNVGNSGRPVIVNQHYQPSNEGWWTRAAIDKWYKVLQDYNVIVALTGHQGGVNSAVWRGINWSNSNGTLDIYHITPDNKLNILERTEAGEWIDTVQRPIFTSYATSGLAAAVNNGDWATNITPASATLSGKLLHQGAASTQATIYWGATDGGTTPANWQNSRDLGTVSVGTPFTTEVTGLQPWTTYYYRVRVTNSMGSAWAVTSIDFSTAGNLPSGWNTRFIGYEQRSGGGAKESAGAFTVRGSGRDIGEPGQGIDNFQYAYRSLTGDGEIRARIATMPVASRDPKVGVMLRETLDSNSRQSSVLLCATEGIRFMNRAATTGGSTATSANNAITTAPYWVKLTRSGNTFTGYMSADGNTWTQVGNPATITMPETIYAGIPVTAGNRDGSVHHTSTFDNVFITGANDQVYVDQWQSMGNHNSTPQALVIPESPTVEPRQSGIRNLQISSSAPISVSNAATAVSISGINRNGVVNPGDLGITSNASANGNVLTVTFLQNGSPVALPDATKWRFSLNTYSISGIGNLVLMPSASTTRVISGLAGDVDGNGRIAGTDLNLIGNTGSFNPNSPQSLRCDINGDGAIDQLDINAAWSNRSQSTDFTAIP